MCRNPQLFFANLFRQFNAQPDDVARNDSIIAPSRRGDEAASDDYLIIWQGAQYNYNTYLLFTFRPSYRRWWSALHSGDRVALLWSIKVTN